MEIIHVDMDAFFVAAERLRHPELLGRPVLVGGAGPRGVVAAASYEARAHGVHSAMPSVQARRLCPEAIFLDGDHAWYSALSRRVMALLSTFTPLVEPLSLDEAFLDVSGARRLHGSGPEVAATIRRRVDEELGLACSVGVAPSKLLAKLASEEAKPTASPQGPIPGAGVVVVLPGEELAFLHGLPVAALWGVGPRTSGELRRLGVRTVGDLAAVPEQALVALLGGAAGKRLHLLARGVDDRAVEPRRALRSVSREETYAQDLLDVRELEREVVRLADSVASRLRREGLWGRTVTLKVRLSDFTTWTRSVTLDSPVEAGPLIAAAAKGLLYQLQLPSGVRLLGVGISGLGTEPVRQLAFDDRISPWEDLSRAVDEVRRRFGDEAIGPAAALGLPTGERRGRWGPGAAPT